MFMMMKMLMMIFYEKYYYYHNHHHHYDEDYDNTTWECATHFQQVMSSSLLKDVISIELGLLV